MANGTTFHRTITVEPEEPAMAVISCDGGCGTDFEFWSELWTCLSDSGSVLFDDECYKKLQAGTLGPRVCNKDHEFYWVPKRDVDKIDAVPRGSVMVEERVITIDEWKDEIRRQYVDLSAS
ncbi:hypothetical protein NM208_g13120 [Fusarium decemcellulare]|uniref:Uncharacterized protein n=1 Tax=Fusarium decemcellulare TaxID=57161 RepID=A0ACC1RL55_9HYPO|nr:hypothetical protein NM208_g13120 [Fusarium decemcellulare]